MTYYSNPPSGGSFQCYPNTQAPYDEIIACPEGDFQVAYKCPGQGLGLYLNLYSSDDFIQSTLLLWVVSDMNFILNQFLSKSEYA